MSELNLSDNHSVFKLCVKNDPGLMNLIAFSVISSTEEILGGDTETVAELHMSVKCLSPFSLNASPSFQSEYKIL